MAKGFLYLVVIMDWVSRAVLAWRVSNTLGADFCVEALEEALSRYGRPEIFNTERASHSVNGTSNVEAARRPRTTKKHSAAPKSNRERSPSARPYFM
jgi:transposase InsO family protein